MKKNQWIFSTLLVLLALTACGDHDITPRDYPRLSTREVTDITNNSAKFGAVITFRDDFEILQYGFAWSSTDPFPKYETAEKVIYAGDVPANEFSSDVHDLKHGLLYHVRPFVITDSYTVYGKTVKFNCL